MEGMLQWGAAYMQHFGTTLCVPDTRRTVPVYVSIDAVPRRYAAPNSWLTHRGEWPVGPFRADTPEYAVAVAYLVQACDAAMLQTGDSLRAVARRAGIDIGSLSRMMNGQTVPDLGTVVALESALDADLWPVRSAGRSPS